MFPSHDPITKEEKDKLFEDNLDKVELEFFRNIPEIKGRLKEMEKPENNGYHTFEIPMNDIIPNCDLTVAAKCNWETGAISLTHYKLEERDAEA